MIVYWMVLAMEEVGRREGKCEVISFSLLFVVAITTAYVSNDSADANVILHTNLVTAAEDAIQQKV